MLHRRPRRGGFFLVGAIEHLIFHFFGFLYRCLNGIAHFGIGFFFRSLRCRLRLGSGQAGT